MAAPPLLKSTLTLSNGLTIPQLQLGLYMMSPQEASFFVSAALKIGYRGFDSAQWYFNEGEAGKAITSFLSSAQENTANLQRKDIFFTTKLRDNDVDYDRVRKSIKRSVQVCGLGYVDLFLLHSPYGGREARLTSWKAVEDAITDGEVRMGGVSNFGVKHIEELMASNPRVKPVINQIEVHPFNTQSAIRDVCAKHGITIEAYAPLARALKMKHAVILQTAKKYSCTPAQVFVKWGLQHGLVSLPKSVQEKRLVENASVEGFEMSKEDMGRLDELDEHLVTDWDPTDAP